MRRKWFYIWVLIAGCSGQVAQESSQDDAVDSATTAVNVDSLSVKTPEPVAEYDTTLSSFNTFDIDSLFDLKAFKQGHRSANSSVGCPDTMLHDLGYGRYCYFFFTNHLRKLREVPGVETFQVTTAVHQPITGQERFLTIKETFIGLNCSLNDPLLQKLDLVGLSKEAVSERLGDLLADTKHGLIFGQGQQVIAVTMEDGKVKSFRYCYLKSDVSTILGDEFFLKYLFNIPSV